MRKLVPFLLTGALTLAFVFAGSTRSEAAMMAYVCADVSCSLGGDIIITDGGAGDTLGGVTGAIGIATTFNGWELVASTNESKPLLGSAALPQLDINYSLTNSTGSAGPIYLFVSDTDFTGFVSVTTQLGGTSTISPFTIEALSWGGSSNTDHDLTNPLCSAALVFTTTPYSGSCTGGPVGSLVNPYSLTLGMVVLAGEGATGAVTGDLGLHSAPVPEPATLFLFGSGLVGAAMRLRRRRAA